MALVLQDDTGTIAGANAYVDVAYFKAYHDDRGGDYSAYTDDQIEKAIIRATDYTDTRFRFVGDKLSGRGQTTAWPRSSALDRDDNLITDVPREVKDAVCEYAFRALSAALVADPTRDETGRYATSTSFSAGPVSESVSFSGAGGFSMPDYPAADRKIKLAGLVCNGGILIRG
jgi:hypothetical protein